MIESVETQTFKAWEHIIVDDGSTDNSVEVVEKYASSFERIRLIQQSNQGVGVARNIGFEASSDESDYVLFLDADDVLKPHMLEFLVDYLDVRPHLGFVTTRPELIDEDGQPIDDEWRLPRWVPTLFGMQELPQAEPAIPPFAAFTGSFLPSATLIRREAFAETRGFDTTLHPCEDNDLFAQIALLREVHLLDRPLVYYRRHSVQSTSDKDKLWRQKDALVEKWGKKRPYLPDKEQADRLRIWRMWHSRYVPHYWRRHASQEWQKGNAKKAMILYTASMFRWVYFSIFDDKDGYNRIVMSLRG